MPHLSCKYVFPLPAGLFPAEEKHVVIVSDSTLKSPAVIYGLQCKVREYAGANLRLLWIAAVPGGGAKYLADTWIKAPYRD